MTAALKRYLINETYVDVDCNIQCGTTGWYEYPYDCTRGDIYRDRREENGRCTGKLYQDRKDANGKWGVDHIGWCFVKKHKYEDRPDKDWLCETWVTIREVPRRHCDETATSRFHRDE